MMRSKNFFSGISGNFTKSTHPKKGMKKSDCLFTSLILFFRKDGKDSICF